MAFGETSQDQPPGTVDATGDFVSEVLTSTDSAAKTNPFCEEIANGRLAMRAITAYMAFGETSQDQSPGTVMPRVIWSPRC
jgi:hypothetical protein